MNGVTGIKRSSLCSGGCPYNYILNIKTIFNLAIGLTDRRQFVILIKELSKRDDFNPPCYQSQCFADNLLRVNFKYKV